METFQTTITIRREQAQLLLLAIRWAAELAQERADSGEYTDGLDQPAQLRWIARYLEHKFRDAAGGPILP